MTRPTYREQLRHPLWQRKRLEVLDAAGFACEWCHDTENTLNVHHRRYVRGRLAWEYEAWELECLCETCHERAGAEMARLDTLLAALPSSLLSRVVGVLGGFLFAHKFGPPTVMSVLDKAMTTDVFAGATARGPKE